MTDKLYTDVLNTIHEMVVKTDEINKRLVMAVIVMSICMSLTITLIVGFYFFADYLYPSSIQEVEQTLEGSQKAKQEIK